MAPSPPSPTTTGMNVGLFLVLYVLLTTGLPSWNHFSVHGHVGRWGGQLALSFFLGLNSLICLWEIGLGLHIGHIEKEHKRLWQLHGREPWAAVVAFFMAPLSLRDCLSSKFWTTVWATYSLYDPSYSNRQSFGFFVDVSNGWVTLLPSLLFWYAMTYDVPGLSARALGCLGLVKFYLEFHGTCVYFLSYVLNERYRGRSALEVGLFVGFSNGLWFVFPLLGVALSLSMINSDSFAVFR